ALQIVEHFSTAFEVEPAPVHGAVMHELERAVVADALRADDRRAEVVFRRQYRLVQRRQVLVEYFYLSVAARAVAEQSELLGELTRQVIAHETEVIVLLHDAPGAFEPLILDDLLPHADAEMVGIDAERDLLLRGYGSHHVRVALDGIEVCLLRHEVGL